ncbi:hypothetical protein A5893_01755 [Pedobacter psychrophilus]|uniref:Lipid/polyisoprenoid-binding YceI-like domain-containing protein n=1 Tax=Pedobacter psychrophilus TaxID=1826909 RepID=A0A179DLU5_9SPHI|nr:YceI family protein [Pedobacter psychrophilus]OAQ41868.1 hypothetical protein A5893_01755 [Pedobacter psychrophilus]
MVLLKKASKIYLLIGIILSLSYSCFGQTNFTAKDMKVGIFSTTPLEDIKAQSVSGTSVLVPKTKQIVFQLPIKSLVFSRSLMQEHFNESYMESDKYPTATFKGNILENIDFTKDGVYDVSSKGILNIHGVAKERTIKGKMTIKNGKPSIYSSFDVACADHDIKIPSVVFKKIAEVITITVSGNYK